MNTSENLSELGKALAAAQTEITNPTKNKNNPHFKSSYADLAGGLDTIRPILGKHGLSVIQMTRAEGDMVFLYTRLLHSSGQWVEATYPVCRLGKHQEMMSALTYSRRACLFAVCGVAGEEEDDDGNSAATARGRPSVSAPTPRATEPAPPAPPPGKLSSAAMKREKPTWWPELEAKVRGASDIDALTTLWDETQEQAEILPQTWQDARWELFEARTEELKAQREAAE